MATKHIDLVKPVYTAENNTHYGEVLRHKHHSIVYACIYTKPRPTPDKDNGQNLISSVPFTGEFDAREWIDRYLAINGDG